MPRSLPGLIALLALAIAPAARGDDSGRVVAGRVVDAAGRPVAGAKVRFEAIEPPRPMVDNVATSDADGRYRLDATKHAWSAAKLRARALAPGFRVGTATPRRSTSRSNRPPGSRPRSGWSTRPGRRSPGSPGT